MDKQGRQHAHRAAPFRRPPTSAQRDHLLFLEQLLATNCLLSLEEMAGLLESELGVTVSRQTVARALDSLGYSVKTTHVEKDSMNAAHNKDKRKAFLLALLE